MEAWFAASKLLFYLSMELTAPQAHAISVSPQVPRALTAGVPQDSNCLFDIRMRLYPENRVGILHCVTGSIAALAGYCADDKSDEEI